MTTVEWGGTGDRVGHETLDVVAGRPDRRHGTPRDI